MATNFLAQFQENGKHYRKVLFVIVYIALFLDNMLVTVVVPIIPPYLHELDVAASCESQAKEMNQSTEFHQLSNYSNFSDSLPWNFTNNVTIGKDKTLSGNVERFYAEETFWVGLLFGSKATVQLITNPFVGPLTNRIGFKLPMFAGFVILFSSTLIFAFAKSYPMLLVARAFQGAGSACTATSGLGMLAAQYTDRRERGAAMGVALGGLALGILVGPPFGGVLYEYYGKELPFIILATVALIDGAIQFVCLKPKVEKKAMEGASLFTLISDPYIAISAGAITMACFGIAILEPTMPFWMMETMGAKSATIGLVYLPISLCYLAGVHIFSPIGHKIGRWFLSIVGLTMAGASLASIPWATNEYWLLVPNGFLGFGLGIFDAMIFPEMGHLVDIRHVGIYGSVYSIADGSVCFAFACGPFLSGILVKAAGFPLLFRIIGIITICYTPLIIFLRRPKIPQKMLEAHRMQVRYTVKSSESQAQ